MYNSKLLECIAFTLDKNVEDIFIKEFKSEFEELDELEEILREE